MVSASINSSTTSMTTPASVSVSTLNGEVVGKKNLSSSTNQTTPASNNCSTATANGKVSSTALAQPIPNASVSALVPAEEDAKSNINSNTNASSNAKASVQSSASVATAVANKDLTASETIDSSGHTVGDGVGVGIGDTNSNSNKLSSNGTAVNVDDSDSPALAVNCNEDSNAVGSVSAASNDSSGSGSGSGNRSCPLSPNSLEALRGDDTSGEKLSKTNLYIRGLSDDYDDVKLFDLCKNYGQIVSTKAILHKNSAICKGYGFVDFSSEDEAQRAVVDLQKVKVQAQMARQQEQDLTNIYISNLPKSFDDKRLAKLFGEHGQVVSTRVLRDHKTNTSKGVGFVRMETQEVCEKAIAGIHNQPIPGCNERILCKFADAMKAKNKYDYHPYDNSYGNGYGHSYANAFSRSQQGLVGGGPSGMGPTPPYGTPLTATGPGANWNNLYPLNYYQHNHASQQSVNNAGLPVYNPYSFLPGAGVGAQTSNAALLNNPTATLNGQQNNNSNNIFNHASDVNLICQQLATQMALNQLPNAASPNNNLNAGGNRTSNGMQKSANNNSTNGGHFMPNASNGGYPTASPINHQTTGGALDAYSAYNRSLMQSTGNSNLSSSNGSANGSTGPSLDGNLFETALGQGNFQPNASSPQQHLMNLQNGSVAQFMGVPLNYASSPFGHQTLGVGVGGTPSHLGSSPSTASAAVSPFQNMQLAAAMAAAAQGLSPANVLQHALFQHQHSAGANDHNSASGSGSVGIGQASQNGQVSGQSNSASNNLVSGTNNLTYQSNNNSSANNSTQYSTSANH